MKSRLLRFASLFLLSLVLVTACNGTTIVTSRPEQPPLEVGYNLWPGLFPIAIAQEKEFFTAQGVKVKPVYIQNFLESVSEFTAGQYDGVAITVGSLMSIIGKNPDVQIAMATDESSGSDSIVVRPDVKSVADLKGKRLGVRLGDGELFVSQMLQKHGLTTDDVTLVNVEGEAVPARFKSGDIQAGHTWEPYLSEVTKSGGRVLFTSKDTPGLISTVIVFRTSVVRDRPQDIQAFIRAWFQAQDYWKANPEESKALIAKTLSIKPEEVSTEGVKLYTLKDNLKAFTPGSTTESLYHTAKLYSDFYIRTGGLSTAPDIQKLINPSFVQPLQAGS
ncbi:ABC transporter substrate-binding protein [Funiculus sociatus GB2-A5]|uniref:ABC transporter substrate-binding protein n=2 Tax=Cyanophyceae TaxID=3028117 RepID=A0ABV0JJS2_9CYAN|nr:ABC transporter substrate-binding protein [Trichocoleus sp. FACHB-6]MBD2063497.1 ABC transporter substrate-binding protein [Trichocoleus sp. FACHB-6]